MPPNRAIAEESAEPSISVLESPDPLVDEPGGILPECYSTKGGQIVGCGAKFAQQLSATLVEVANDTIDGVPAFRYVPYERLVPGGGPNGETCVENGLRAVPNEPAPSGVSELTRALEGLRNVYPSCPIERGADPTPETPETYAVEFWQDVPLPSPQPYIAPGRAITGMFAYLETRGTTTQTFTEPNTPFGPMTVVATGKYYVDWGDGTRTGPHSREGGQWPDGQIKHEYINIGAYDVIVTERWTATWSFGDRSGILSELRTVGRIDDFPVQQIQAVVLQ